MVQIGILVDSNNSLSQKPAQQPGHYSKLILLTRAGSKFFGDHFFIKNKNKISCKQANQNLYKTMSILAKSVEELCPEWLKINIGCFISFCFHFILFRAVVYEGEVTEAPAPGTYFEGVQEWQPLPLPAQPSSQLQTAPRTQTVAVMPLVLFFCSLCSAVCPETPDLLLRSWMRKWNLSPERSKYCYKLLHTMGFGLFGGGFAFIYNGGYVPLPGVSWAYFNNLYCSSRLATTVPLLYLWQRLGCYVLGFV